MQKITSQWIELRCSQCGKHDRMPLNQHEEYKIYGCPYEKKEDSRCFGRMIVLKIRSPEFSPDI